MTENEQSFLELAEDIFYNFSQIERGSIDLTFSKKVLFPSIKSSSELEIIIPLPRKQEDKYVFEGMLFDNMPRGRRNLLCLFLATIYHLAAHVKVSRYSKYDSWKKYKTEDVCLRVISCIEDMSVEKYISQTDLDIWTNMKNMKLKLISENQKKYNESNNVEHSTIFGLADREKITKMRTSMMVKSGNAMIFANLLYRNRELLPDEILPFCERSNVQQALKIEKSCPDFEPYGLFKENVANLNELWLADEQFKSKMLRKYEKNLKGLNFDSIVIPQGNFHNFQKIKEKTEPLLKKIRQQIRMIENVVDESQPEQIGYLNMQMAIQSIASEGQFTKVFEREETRRVEEAWAILIDKSASMNWGFDQIREFTVCVSESANELTGKSDAWALFSFDNNFQILKDFKDKYNNEVRARIGALQNNGLSLLPDAIELTRRMLSEDPRERKYIFVITDGHPSGYGTVNQYLTKITKKLDASGVTLIVIGASKSASKSFRNNVRMSDNLGQLVAKFISVYKTVSSD
ncbi:MAG: VWA domain-containing protein [Thaumarchaeota archaeon]|nr:VWA domain-containing protein [Nitrososphaerota archaeon]